MIVPSAFDAAPIATSRVFGPIAARELLHLELAGLAAEGDGLHAEAPLPGELAPGIGVRVVVELGHHDLVARLPAAAERPAEVERERRHVGAEGDLGRLAAEEVRERAARGLEQGVGLGARRVRPVRVGVVVEQVVAHRVGDRARDLGAAGAVEVGDRQAVVASLEGGEARADGLQAGRGERGDGRRHLGRSPSAQHIPFGNGTGERRMFAKAENDTTNAVSRRLTLRMDDATAVAQARAGDSEAFRLLVERHSRALFKLAYRMTGNEHDAEDVVQDAFLKAYRNLDRFEERSQVSSWLYRIASNCAFDVLRRRKRRDNPTDSLDVGGRARAAGRGAGAGPT